MLEHQIPWDRSLHEALDGKSGCMLKIPPFSRQNSEHFPSIVGVDGNCSELVLRKISTEVVLLPSACQWAWENRRYFRFELVRALWGRPVLVHSDLLINITINSVIELYLITLGWDVKIVNGLLSFYPIQNWIGIFQCYRKKLLRFRIDNLADNNVKWILLLWSWWWSCLLFLRWLCWVHLFNLICKTLKHFGNVNWIVIWVRMVWHIAVRKNVAVGKLKLVV